MKPLSSIFILISFLFVAIGCNKPDQNPELLDPIYLDIQKNIDEAKKQVLEGAKSVETAKLELEQVKAQSGQIVRARKKLSEAERVLVQLRQNEKYWIIRLESRKLQARESYLKSWYKKETWPNPDEFKEYREKNKALNIPQGWDPKNRRIELGLGSSSNKQADAKAAATKSVKGDHGGSEEKTESEHH